MKRARMTHRTVGALAVLAALLAAMFSPIAVSEANAAGPYSPQNLRVSGVYQFGAVASWDAPTSPVTEYQVYLNGNDQGRQPSSNRGHFWDSLRPDTTYEVAVVGIAANGQRSERVAIEFTTAGPRDIELFFPDSEIEVTEGDQYFAVPIVNDAPYGVVINEGGISAATRPGTATAGEDYYGTFVTETGIRDYDDVRFVYIDIIDDDIVEPNETFQVRLFNPTGGGKLPADDAGYGHRIVTVTIVDDDEPAGLDPVWVYLHTSLVGEGWNNQVLELRAAHSASAPLPRNGFSVSLSTVGGSAQPGSDFYGFYRYVTFPPGVDRVTIPITVVDDAVTENEETFGIRLFSPTNERIKFDRQGPVRIRDND